MSRWLRPLYVLVLLQGLCLGIGLWLHDRFLITATRWSHDAAGRVEQAGTIETPRAAAELGSVAHLPRHPSSGIPMEELRTHELLQMMPAANAIAFIWVWGLQSVVAYFLLARMQGEHARRISQSDEQTLHNTRDLVRTRDAVIFGLAKLAESRDPDTGHHLERISLYSTRLAAALSRIPRYRADVTPAFVRLIGISSALHDIGKVGVEDSVLLKAGELTSSERFHIQLHAQVGSDCIREIERRLGTSNFLEMAREIAHSHHERWDGSGYPDGLAGERIPLAARIVAIADVYDALSSRRVYKDAKPHDECVAVIRDESGKQFDPALVRVFLENESQFRDIASQFSDDSASVDPYAHPDEYRARFTPEQERILLAALHEADSVPANSHIE